MSSRQNIIEKHLPNIITNKSSPREPASSSMEIDDNIYEFILKPKFNNRQVNFNKDKDQPALYHRDHKPMMTFKSRHGTMLWPKPEDTPGPGAHDHTKFTSVKPSKPSFSITNAYNLNVNYPAGPYAVI
jgi:hypothetical protein